MGVHIGGIVDIPLDRYGKPRYQVTSKGCWEWLGCKTRGGYGRMYAGDRLQLAHRVFYEKTVGPIPQGFDLHHKCDNPSCVNPSHLTPATRGDNVLASRSAKLTLDQAIEVRRRRRAGEKLAGLAKEFGVTPQRVYQLAHGIARSDLPLD
jgi:hypothetical protein